MNANLTIKFIVRFIAVSCLALQTASSAGFHYQLDLTAKLVTNTKNEVTAIQMSWVYDKELSAILMDGEDLSEAKQAETLKRRAADILTGLRDVKFFTTVAVDQKPLAYADVETYSLNLYKASRLQLNLTLPFEQLTPLKGHTFDIIVTDDSAVGLATFIDTDHLLLSDPMKALCKPPTLTQQKLAEVDGHAQIIEIMSLDCKG